MLSLARLTMYSEDWVHRIVLNTFALPYESACRVSCSQEKSTRPTRSIEAKRGKPTRPIKAKARVRLATGDYRPCALVVNSSTLLPQNETGRRSSLGTARPTARIIACLRMRSWHDRIKTVSQCHRHAIKADLWIMYIPANSANKKGDRDRSPKLPWQSELSHAIRPVYSHLSWLTLCSSRAAILRSSWRCLPPTAKWRSSSANAVFQVHDDTRR